MSDNPIGSLTGTWELQLLGGRREHRHAELVLHQEGVTLSGVLSREGFTVSLSGIQEENRLVLGGQELTTKVIIKGALAEDGTLSGTLSIVAPQADASDDGSYGNTGQMMDGGQAPSIETAEPGLPPALPPGQRMGPRGRPFIERPQRRHGRFGFRRTIDRNEIVFAMHREPMGPRLPPPATGPYQSGFRPRPPFTVFLGTRRGVPASDQ